jgi:ATP-independent RNA helicase DbpA
MSNIGTNPLRQRTALKVGPIGRTGRAGNEGLAITLFAPENAIKAEQYEKKLCEFRRLSELSENRDYILCASNQTMVIEAGKKDKIRAGDILGALTGDCGLKGNDIGKIDIGDIQSHVAISKTVINMAYKKLKNGKIKKRRIGVWLLS